MRNAVYAAISMVVAIVAVVLALRQDGEPAPGTAVTTVTTASAPDPRPSIPTSTPTPARRATATPPATPAPRPPATPTPPAPGMLTLTPSSGVAVPTPTPAAPASPPIPYGRIDATGETSTPGSYAFLMPADDAIRVAATYEEWRTASTVARFNVVDADGVSHAERFDTVGVGDLIEWRQAEDCWTRYEVTSTPPPAPGAATREFGVRWMTYAFTGCGGPIQADAEATLAFGPLPDLGNPSLAYPIRHGPWQLVPEDWSGAIEAVERGHPPWRSDRNPLPTTTLFKARQMTYWRDPVVPPGWTLQHAERWSASPHWYGYQATYGTTTGLSAFTVSAATAFLGGDLTPMECAVVCYETRVIAGRPARIAYTPPGPFVPAVSLATVWVYDAEFEAEYVVRETDHRLFGGRISEAIEVARSLFQPQPETPGVARYGRLDTSGAADEPGSYAFMSGTGAAAPAVTTFEELRDGSATALLVHTADVDGASHRATFDSVRAGDRFEWRRADDCWVRYQVTEVLPDPLGATPRKLLGVESETYAFTGCYGEMPPNAYATFDFNPLPDLGGTSLAVPVVHGPWQLVPEGWDGGLGIRSSDQGSPGQSHDSVRAGSSDLAAARAGPHWRAPTLPSTWTFEGAFSGPLTSTTSGYCASWNNPGGSRAVEICGASGTSAYAAIEASWDDGAGVREFRIIAGRPALLAYSPPGPRHDEDFRAEVSVYDAATNTAYTIVGREPTLSGSNVDAVIEIVRSLFEPPNVP